MASWRPPLPGTTSSSPAEGSQTLKRWSTFIYTTTDDCITTGGTDGDCQRWSGTIYLSISALDELWSCGRLCIRSCKHVLHVLMLRLNSTLRTKGCWKWEKKSVVATQYGLGGVVTSTCSLPKRMQF
jgi:hypothetical protein